MTKIRAGVINPIKDATTYAAIYQGVTASQLGAIFHVDDRKVREAIASLKPCGTGNRGAPIYKIHEAAQALVKPKIAPEELRATIKDMHFTDLPTVLKKEFWAGERLRQDYMIKAGELWSTEEVIQKVGELFKLVKMSAQLMSDAVERSAELSDRQRAIIKQLTDGMLVDLKKKVESEFKPVPKADDGKQSVEDL